MSAGKLLKAGWGLADDLLEMVDKGPTERRCLVVVVGSERFAVPHEMVREIVDGPKVAPWLPGNWVVGVLALRGEICTLIDPVGAGAPRRIAVLLERPGRRVALAVDDLAGVHTFAEADWKDFEDGRFDWARRIHAGTGKATLWLDPDLMLATLDRRNTKETLP